MQGLLTDHEKWEAIINEVNASDVPVEMLKYLRVHLSDGTKYVFPILQWSNDDGMNYDQIKMIILNWMNTNKSNILGSDFVVNLDKLKNTVTTATANTLKNL